MRLNQVTVATTDMPASIAFYKTLGLKLIVLSSEYARFETGAGESTFSLHFTLGEIPRENAPAIYFECDDLDAEVARLKASGVTFASDPEDKRWKWREAWLRDPAGNAVCLYHAGEVRRFPPWRLPDDAGPRHLHVVILDDAMLLVKRDVSDWRALQDEFPAYKTSLGPYDLYDVLATLESEWPQIYAARADAVKAFVASDDTTLKL